MSSERAGFLSRKASSHQPPLPIPGKRFARKYFVVRVLGGGGMGIVFEAIHLGLQLRVAIKTLLSIEAADDDLLSGLSGEARAMARLQSRHVARTLDIDMSPEGLPYIVMEYLDGRDLEVELQRRGKLAVEESVGLILQACDAMREAHAAGIVHRDIKPANLFVCTIDGGSLLKVLDFGISKIAGEHGRTRARHALGTPL
jgi:eukaryotic-like serine/threonine-protein kinase